MFEKYPPDKSAMKCECVKCRYKWVSRLTRDPGDGQIIYPKSCPACKSYKWRDES